MGSVKCIIFLACIFVAHAVTYLHSYSDEECKSPVETILIESMSFNQPTNVSSGGGCGVYRSLKWNDDLKKFENNADKAKHLIKTTCGETGLEIKVCYNANDACCSSECPTRTFPFSTNKPESLQMASLAAGKCTKLDGPPALWMVMDGGYYAKLEGPVPAGLDPCATSTTSTVSLDAPDECPVEASASVGYSMSYAAVSALLLSAIL